MNPKELIILIIWRYLSDYLQQISKVQRHRTQVYQCERMIFNNLSKKYPRKLTYIQMIVKLMKIQVCIFEWLPQDLWTKHHSKTQRFISIEGKTLLITHKKNAIMKVGWSCSIIVVNLLLLLYSIKQA